MNQVAEAFRLAYQVDPAWATANLTTWMVFVGGAAAVANVAVVATAFLIQSRQFHRDAVSEAIALARLHVSALTSAKNSLQMYDAVLGPRDNGVFSRTDAVGRLGVVKRFMDHYLSQGIIDTGVLYALVTVLTLVERVIADIEILEPADRDTLPIDLLVTLREFRQELRVGAEEIVDLGVEISGGHPTPESPKS